MLKVRVLVLALASVCLFARPLPLAGADVIVSEDFASSPALHGWQAYGDSSLFTWNAANQNLEVTWDSSKANSYFCHALGGTLTRSNDFVVRFDLRLTDVVAGPDPEKPYAFELAVGLLNLTNATNVDFLRGTGFTSPNLVEFTYFPDAGLSATVAPTIISSNNEYGDGGFTFPLELTPGDLFHVEMEFTAAEQTLRTRVTRNGQAFGPVKDVTLGAGFSDFAVDQLAISSYSDAGQDPMWSGSILAHGTVDNLVVQSPPLPVAQITGGVVGATWRVEVASRTGWMYQLERTTDFQTWSGVSEVVAGTGGDLILTDTQMPPAKAFYRVRAQKP